MSRRRPAGCRGEIEMSPDGRGGPTVWRPSGHDLGRDARAGAKHPLTPPGIRVRPTAVRPVERITHSRDRAGRASRSTRRVVSSRAPPSSDPRVETSENRGRFAEAKIRPPSAQAGGEFLHHLTQAHPATNWPRWAAVFERVIVNPPTEESLRIRRRPQDAVGRTLTERRDIVLGERGSIPDAGLTSEARCCRAPPGWCRRGAPGSSA